MARWLRTAREGRVSVLIELNRQRDLWVRCPHCDDEFRVAEAGLFDATKKLPDAALARLEQMRADLREMKEVLVKRREQAREKPKIAAKAANIGKTVEKIAPSLAGFPARAEECRALFEPIDYVVFKGLRTGKVEALLFVDVKSGGAQLAPKQRQIKAAVEGGKVSLVVKSLPEERP
jgi:predicted Holliday junction resolvase-like endonuclease